MAGVNDLQNLEHSILQTILETEKLIGQLSKHVDQLSSEFTSYKEHMFQKLNKIEVENAKLKSALTRESSDTDEELVLKLE